MADLPITVIFLFDFLLAPKVSNRYVLYSKVTFAASLQLKIKCNKLSGENCKTKICKMSHHEYVFLRNSIKKYIEILFDVI